MSERHNGYANRQTWTVSLWLCNQETHKRFVESLRGGDVYEVGESLQEYVGRMVNKSIKGDSSLAKDFVNSALSVVDWHELATMYAEEE